MNQQHPYRPIVKAIPEDVSRPLWSVLIPTYNCAEYLRETLLSVLAQDPGVDQMQILVVDNCSTIGDTAAIVKEIGAGRVEFYQQQENVGMMNNFQTCLELSRGKLIHLLCSDDCVNEGFYEKMTQPFLKHPEVGAAFCRSMIIDEYSQHKGLSNFEQPQSGILPPAWLERIAETCCISVPSLAIVRREVYEEIGGFDSRCGLSADWEMWVRIFAHYQMWYEVEPLALWRQHSMSANHISVKSTIFIQENFDTVETIFKTYLPQAANGRISRKVKQNCAFLALEAADFSVRQGNMVEAIAQIQTALKYSISYKVVRSAGRIYLWQWSLKLLGTMLKSGEGQRKLKY